MPKKQQEGFNSLNQEEAANLSYMVGDSLSCLTEGFLNWHYGRRFWNFKRIMRGGIAGMVFIVAFPRHEAILTQFLTLWLAVIVVHSVIANVTHLTGWRQITTYCGTPLVAVILPAHFSRRVLNPLITYGIATQIEDRALSTLITLSALGQVIVYGFQYAMKRAMEDARGDAELMGR